ncbi:MAG: hypothetical protein WBO10_14725 [Pyrinomonadaceae bacterium]
MTNTIRFAISTLVLALSANIAFAQPPTTAEAHYTLGRQQMSQNNFAGAIKSLGECLRLNANAQPCIYARGVAYFQNKQYGLSAADFSKLLSNSALAPKDKMQALNGRLQALCHSGKIEDAIKDETAIKALGGNIQKTCVQFLAENPSLRPKFEINKKPENTIITPVKKSAEEWFKLGSEQFEKKKYFDAIGSFSGCIASNPSNQRMSDCYANRGIAYFNIDKFKEAISDVTVAIKTISNAVDLYKIRYWANCEQGVFNDAVKAEADQITKLGGRVGTTCGEAMKSFMAENKGDMAYTFGSFETAIQGYNEAISWRKLYSPRLRFSALIKRRNSYCGIGAIELFERDEKTLTDFGWNPGKPCETNSPKIITESGFIKRGNELYQKELYDEASFYFDLALKLNPNSKEANYGRGRSSLNGTDNVMISPEFIAIDYLNKAIKIDPRYTPAYQVRAEAYCKLSKNSFSGAESKQKNLALAKADEKKVVELGGKVTDPCN